MEANSAYVTEMSTNNFARGLARPQDLAFLIKTAIFRPNIELEAIARQPIKVSREVICAYFGNIGRNSGYFLLPIFFGSYLNVHPSTTSSSHCWVPVTMGYMLHGLKRSAYMEEHLSKTD